MGMDEDEGQSCERQGEAVGNDGKWLEGGR
jgi:hypothetical protein